MQQPLSSMRLRAVLIAVAGAAALSGAPALAQATGEDAVSQCRSQLTDAARIACLEEALTGSRPTAQPAAPQTDAQAAALPPSTVTTAATAATTSDEVPERRGGFGLPGIPLFGGGNSTTEVLVSSDDPAAEEFGDEMVTARLRGTEDARVEVIERLLADVTSSREVGYRQLEVELDNGQVWRQVAGDDPWDSRRYDDPERVEIYASRTGGYRLHIPDTHITLAVERIQ